MSIRTAMTYDMPMSLQQCCLDFICNNLDVLCQEIRLPRSINVKLAFKNSDVFFNENISEEFLKTLCEKGKINDETLSLFDPNFMNLKRVCIKDAQVSASGLRILKTQKILELEVSGLGNVTVNDVIGSLGQWTLDNLRTLHVSNLKLIHTPNIMGVRNCLNTADLEVNIASLRSLQYLDVSNTELNMSGLEIIAEELPCLEVLNISCTRIDDISPLWNCRYRLKYLFMYQLKIDSDIIHVLTELTELVHLDVSCDSYSISQSGSNLDRFRFNVSDLLTRTHCLPNLTSLDISGNEGLKEPILMEFLKSHSGIQFLGLALTQACRYPLFLGDTDAELKTNITVTGEANERQLLECLRRYANRPTYVKHVLCKLHTLTQTMTEPREDILKLVLLAIKQNPKNTWIQEAGISCIVNLLKSERGPIVHPSCLKDIICHTLRAMANFPRHQQIQNNAVYTLFTLFLKRILQDLCDIDNAATLIMECICSFDVPAMLFRCLYMFDHLTAKISTDMGSNPRYIKKLLQLLENSIVNERIEIGIDAVLNALGNLTACSHAACEVFMDEGGLDLSMRMFRAAPKLIFCKPTVVEHILLEILYNIVQMERLRHRLLRPDLIRRLKNFQNAQLFLVRFLAAAIITHLASDGENKRFIEEVEPHMLDDLKELILSWEQPEEQKIDCRSFNHFCPLLNCIDTPAVQLWALWSIQHICIHNGELRCRMIEEEGVVTLLSTLVEDSQTDDDVVKIIKDILQLMEHTIQ